MSSTANPRHRVLVIGAGIVGHACALRLQAAGHDVVLTDPDADWIGPSWGNAGHIATEQTAPLASPAELASAWRRLYAFGGALDLRRPWTLLPWIVRYVRACSARRAAAGQAALSALLEPALPTWRRLVDSLAQPDLLRDAGHRIIWESAGSAQRGRAHWQAAATGTATFVDLDERARLAMETLLRVPVAAGIAFSGTGQIADLPRLASAMANSFAAAGGERRHDRVKELRCEQGLARVVLEDGSVMDTDRIVVCAGVQSGPLLVDLGETAPLIAERGYHLQWGDHDWPDQPPLVFEDRSIILTRFESGLRLAGFVEFAAFDTPPDESKWRRLQQHANELGLPVRGEPTRWFGARPTLPDYLPAIGRCRSVDNVHYAFGHQHLGLTLAAITGELIAQLLDGDEPDVSLAAFDLSRFGRLRESR